MMKPLCKKIYLDKIIEIIILIIGTVFDILFVINMGDDLFLLVAIIPLSAMLVYFLIDSAYWIFQPDILIYQYETGIIIGRNKKIEYTSIQRVYLKNYIRKKRRGDYYKDTYSGIIYIQLKSGKIYKIRNVFYPLEAVDAISRIKQHKKYR